MPPLISQYIEKKAFLDVRLKKDPEDITYVLWYNRHDSFRRAVLKRVLELVDHFVQPQPAEDKKPFISTRRSCPSERSDFGESHEPAATEPVRIESRLRFKGELHGKKPPKEKVCVSKEYDESKEYAEPGEDEEEEICGNIAKSNDSF